MHACNWRYIQLLPSVHFGQIWRVLNNSNSWIFTHVYARRLYTGFSIRSMAKDQDKVTQYDHLYWLAVLAKLSLWLGFGYCALSVMGWQLMQIHSFFIFWFINSWQLYIFLAGFTGEHGDVGMRWDLDMNMNLGKANYTLEMRTHALSCMMTDEQEEVRKK